MEENKLPSYLDAADMHNLGNTQTSWLNPDDWGTKFGNAGKFIQASALSGYNGIANTLAAVGSWAGMDTKQESNYEFISSVDSDLGQYYRANEQAVDLAGFIGTSIIPGLAGVKVLNMGQKALQVALNTGKIGGNLGKATGLLAPNIDKAIAASASQINSSLAATKLMNLNTVRALGAGAGQGALEAVAAETFIQATMFKNPILDQQDLGDIGWNLVTGIGVGGVLGAAFSAPKVVSTLKTLVGQEQIARRPFTELPQFAARTSQHESIVQTAWDLEMTAMPFALLNADGTKIVNNFAVNKTLYEGKLAKGFNAIRTSTHELAEGNTLVGNMVANASAPVMDTTTGMFKAGYAQGYFENFSGLKAIGAGIADTKLEKEVAAALKAGTLTESPLSFKWLKLHGDDAGKLVDETPQPFLRLADMAASPSDLLEKVKSYGFTVKEGTPTWSVLGLKGTKGHLEAEARYIWAQKILQTDKMKPGYVVDEFDIPLLEALYEKGKLDVRIQRGSGPSLELWEPGSQKELFDLIKDNKLEAASKLLEKRTLTRGGKESIEVSEELIPRMVNVQKARLQGEIGQDEVGELFAHIGNRAEYLEQLQLKELTFGSKSLATGTKITDEFADPMLLPSYAKLVYGANERVAETTPAIADALTYFAQKQKIFQQEADAVVASVLGQTAENLPTKIPVQAMTAKDMASAGPGLVSFANGNYGSLGSYMQWIGSVTKEMKQTFRKELSDNMGGPLTRLAAKPEAAIEFESINQKISQTADQWVVFKDGDQAYMANRKAVKAFQDSQGEMSIDDVLGTAINIKNKETLDAIESHISESGKRVTKAKLVAAQNGKTDNKFDDVFRPIRPDLNRYKHFAFVVDPKVTGNGHVSMIHAASEVELQGLLDRVPPTYKKLLKTDTEEFRKARGEYEFSRTLHENYIDSDLKSRGVFSNFFPKTDPDKIVDDVLSQHLRQSDALVMDTVRLKYQKEFGTLEDLGGTYSKAETSQFASKREVIEAQVDNPYFNHLKLALDISKASEYPLLYDINKALDSAVSKAVGAIGKAWDGMKSPGELAKINTMLDEYGMKPAYYDAALDALANHTAPRGVLTKFIRDANGILARFVLGLDPLNALNNALGSNILRNTELNSVLRAIKDVNPEIAGELSQLGKIGLPGTGDQVLSATKLTAKAIENFWKDPVGGPLKTKYREMGLIKDMTEQLRLLADDFTLQGTETVSELTTRRETAFRRAKELASKAGETGEKATGNKLAEEFNRFISANVMDQITGYAVKAGVFTQAEAKAYINTFVNRVEGTITASQRPLVFQGPIGQAIGLFQSYQFNLMQQMFRYVGEGNKKDLAMLAGLQTTFFGLNSLPGFQYMNTHIVGQLSGNKEHRDLYDATYGLAGKTAGDFILYGLPSNILQAGIYSRGDLNPRQLTILPTQLSEIPIVNAWGKFFGSMKTTMSEMGAGDNAWQAVLRGVEHNGISRPLAGFAQTLRGVTGPNVFSTQKDGSLLYQHDLWSWSSVVRLAGARPMDEAVTNDGLFRIKTYKQARTKDMKALGQAIKLSLYDNGAVDAQAMEGFAQKFVEKGGKQAQFNKYMMNLYKDTNRTQAELLRGSLTTPFNYKMQLLMGGEDEGVAQ